MKLNQGANYSGEAIGGRHETISCRGEWKSKLLWAIPEVQLSPAKKELNMMAKSATESNHEAKTVRLPPKETESLRYMGALFYRNGWAYGTSSNYSVRLTGESFKLLITASGKDKSSLGPTDFVVVDERGEALSSQMGKPSAETKHGCCWVEPDSLKAISDSNG